MTRLVRTELLKLRTTRTSRFLALAGLAFAALLGFANASIAGDPGSPALGSAAWVQNVLGVSTIPAAVAVLLGVLLSAGEHQHQTITTTFLVTPRRRRVLAAKAVAAAIAGAALAVAMVMVSVATSIPALIAERPSIDLFHADAAETVGGLVLASALVGSLGVLLGMLMRSQMATVVLVVAWFTVLEGVATALVGGSLGRWLPGGAAADLAGNGGQPMGQAALVVLAWTAAVALVATPTVQHRDVA
jgi:hypothetical protein